MNHLALASLTWSGPSLVWTWSGPGQGLSLYVCCNFMKIVVERKPSRVAISRTFDYWLLNRRSWSLQYKMAKLAELFVDICVRLIITVDCILHTNMNRLLQYFSSKLAWWSQTPTTTTAISTTATIHSLAIEKTKKTQPTGRPLLAGLVVSYLVFMSFVFFVVYFSSSKSSPLHADLSKLET